MSAVIKGDSFQDGAQVRLNGVITLTIASHSVTYVDQQTLLVSIPAGLSPGIYDVTVINPDGQQGTLSDGFTVIGPPPAIILSISKTGPATVTVGGLITYTLTVTNSGTATATNILITDTLPSGANYVSGGTLAWNVVAWTVPSLNAGGNLSRTFSVTATQTITNSDYRVTADGDISAAGHVSVVTTIAEDGIHKIYLPIILRNFEVGRALP